MLATLSQANQATATRAGRWLLDPPVTSAQAITDRYAPITLSQMADVALLKRTDTKFVMETGTLLSALSQLHNDYRVLEVDGVRLHHYQTLYFDTADFDRYHRHHAGAANRYKVRSRAYVQSGLFFFEVKCKTNKSRTIKKRLQTAQMQTEVQGETAVFLQHHYPYQPAALWPVLWNSFTRITLVSTGRPERLTLDFDLAFHKGKQQITLPGVAIAEVKREGFTQNSDFIHQMRTLGVRPTAFSKYCLGINYLYPQLKQNNFKPRHLLVQKIIKEKYHGYTH